MSSRINWPLVARAEKTSTAQTVHILANEIMTYFGRCLEKGVTEEEAERALRVFVVQCELARLTPPEAECESYPLAQ